MIVVAQTKAGAVIGRQLMWLGSLDSHKLLVNLLSEFGRAPVSLNIKLGYTTVVLIFDERSIELTPTPNSAATAGWSLASFPGIPSTLSLHGMFPTALPVMGQQKCNRYGPQEEKPGR
jgi:hypothetical protein